MRAALLAILGDRGFWTSITPLLTLALTQGFGMTDAHALVVTGSVQGICLLIDAKLATLTPKGPSGV